MPFRTRDLLEKYGKELQLDLVVGEEGLRRPISLPEAQRPGLVLSGYLKGYVDRRVLVFGRVEIDYLRSLDAETLADRLPQVLRKRTPAVIVCRRLRPPKPIVSLCREEQLPLFRSSLHTSALVGKVIRRLTEEFSPKVVHHGTLADVFGIGILIEGESSVGKSETALGLVEKGHRFIADDIVTIRLREESYLEGESNELTRHHMEIRGIGILNVASLHGAVSVRPSKRIDLVVRLESWNEQQFYDRVGLEQEYCDILGVQLPHFVVPVKPGRDVVLLIETLALNHRLKALGMNAAKEFQSRLHAVLAKK